MVAPTTTNLTALWASPSGDIWVVGEGSTVLRYNGTWTQIPFDAPVNLASVAGTSDQDVLVGGETGALYHWDGVRFSPVRIATSVNLAVMTRVGDTIYIGDDSGGLHRLIRTAPW
jgi:hypothetical protein